MKGWAISLLDLVQSWAGGDRIRIPPTEGRLLALKPGDRLLIRNELYEVLSQIVQSEFIVYGLSDDDQMGELKVPKTSHLLTHQGEQRFAHLHFGNVMVDVFDDDVVVLSARNDRQRNFGD